MLGSGTTIERFLCSRRPCSMRVRAFSNFNGFLVGTMGIADRDAGLSDASQSLDNQRLVP